MIYIARCTVMHEAEKSASTVTAGLGDWTEAKNEQKKTSVTIYYVLSAQFFPLFFIDPRNDALLRIEVLIDRGLLTKYPLSLRVTLCTKGR